MAQFNKFGHVFQIYTQAEPNYRASADDIRNLKVKAGDGTMTPIGTVAEVNEVQGPPLDQPLQSLSVVHRHRRRGAGFSSGQALDIMDQIGEQTLPTGTGYEWTAMSFQEKQVGNQIYYVFGFALLLVYFVLGGPVRELDSAARGDPRRAARPARDGRRADLAGASDVFYSVGVAATISTPRSASSS